MLRFYFIYFVNSCFELINPLQPRRRPDHVSVSLITFSCELSIFFYYGHSLLLLEFSRVVCFWECHPGVTNWSPGHLPSPSRTHLPESFINIYLSHSSYFLQIKCQVTLAEFVLFYCFKLSIRRHLRMNKHVEVTYFSISVVIEASRQPAAKLLVWATNIIKIT